MQSGLQLQTDSITKSENSCKGYYNKTAECIAIQKAGYQPAYICAFIRSDFLNHAIQNKWQQKQKKNLHRKPYNGSRNQSHKKSNCNPFTPGTYRMPQTIRVKRSVISAMTQHNDGKPFVDLVNKCID